MRERNRGRNGVIIWNRGVGLNPRVRQPHVSGISGYAVFVDNLPMSVTKREIYKKFGQYGFITDVFVSRKKMQPEELQTLWKECKLLAKIPRERNEGVANWRKQQNTQDAVKLQRMTQKWIPKKPVDEVEKTNVGKENGNEGRRKEVEAVWDDEQKQRLSRSLLGVSVEPIEFREVMYKLLKKWGGLGEIEVRDVGPFRCLITFETVEIRDAAIHDELLLSLFDEVRHHWEMFWSLSTRVWIEIMGLPIGLWYKENFNRIVKL
ncbi:hypothetical protein PIB30_021596 [Stylosanthes scabra]|uniref:RRM domain-containing protein n=1 Tax=Stylosanthes scabra TaxID=79078 RepID=A0ABU6VB58_9FABA|nr:hypothetical protein [Stylosanthes scabra]